nr:immunoglobulin light chain junction region [Macaca mulatta]
CQQHGNRSQLTF